MLKKVVTILCLVTLTASLAGCAGNFQGKGANGKTIITMSVVQEDMVLQNAVQKYEAAHPNIEIDVKASSTTPQGTTTQSGGKSSAVILTGNPADTEKYVDTVNTELMSGKASDIIALESLPYEKYAEKGLLTDYNSLMNGDSSFNKNDYYTNIFDALNVNGKDYALPIRYRLNLLSANKSILDSKGVAINNNWSWDDFSDIAKKVAGGTGADKKYAMSNLNETDLINSMVTSSYSQFVDAKNKTAKFDSKEFIDLLNTAKGMVDDGLIDTTKTDKMVADASSRGNTVFNLQSLRMAMELSMIKMMYGQGTPVNFYNTPGSGSSTSFSSDMLLGINSKSNNKTEAWNFIKYLLSDDVQSSSMLLGFPVNKKAFDSQLQNAMTPKSGKMMIRTGGTTISGNAVNLTAEDSSMLKNFVGSISKYSDVDSKVMDIIQQEVPAFFSGEKSADAVAKIVQDKVNIYLNE